MNTENLLKLADALEAPLLPGFEFDMSCYTQSLALRVTECGSVGCAVGYATRMIEPKPANVDFEDWGKKLFDLDEREYLWLFSGAWHDCDNTPEGTAARIRDFVANGLPDNWRAQMHGSEPRTYRAYLDAR